jgi:hypothetical protein
VPAKRFSTICARSDLRSRSLILPASSAMAKSRQRAQDEDQPQFGHLPRHPAAPPTRIAAERPERRSRPWGWSHSSPHRAHTCAQRASPRRRLPSPAPASMRAGPHETPRRQIDQIGRATTFSAPKASSDCWKMIATPAPPPWCARSAPCTAQRYCDPHPPAAHGRLGEHEDVVWPGMKASASAALAKAMMVWTESMGPHARNSRQPRR